MAAINHISRLIESTILVEDLKDMSKLTLACMRSYLLKTTNLVGVTRYNRAQLEKTVRRYVERASISHIKQRAQTTVACDYKCVDESRRRFELKVEKRIIDCSSTRTRHINRFKTNYPESTTLCEQKLHKPSYRCVECGKFGMYVTATFVPCGHSLMCDKCCSAADAPHACPECRRPIEMIFMFV